MTLETQSEGESPGTGLFARRRPGAGMAGLYLHVPFCSAICPYCDFAVTRGDVRRRAHFAESLSREIDLWGGSPERFDTVHFGGGTPSALEPSLLGEILDRVERVFDVVADAEICLEANPEDVTEDRLEAWKRLGVRRLSLGVQSLDGEALRFLGRRHDPERARRAVERSLEAAVESVSVDLIFAVPGFGEESWLRTLEEVVAIGPHHVSCYELTIHEKTLFGVRAARGELVELDEDARAALFELTHRRLAEAGYDGYEVSNFALAEEHRSRHNAKYWRHDPYLGLGPSAHSFDGLRRWWNERHLPDWSRSLEQRKRPVAGGERLGLGALVLERLMLGLRTREGLSLEEIESDFGFDLLAENREAVRRLRDQGLLLLDGARLRPSLRGLAVADRLATAFDLKGLERRSAADASELVPGRTETD